MDTGNTGYKRKLNKYQIPTFNVRGVNIAAISMPWLMEFTEHHIKEMSGDYLCVSNVHTTVTAWEEEEYCKIQNGGIMAIPDGGPLAMLARKYGYTQTSRTDGPGYMMEILKVSVEKNYSHFFYGSTEETLDKMKKILEKDYPGIQIKGMYSPPFRPLTEEEDKEVIDMLNKAEADFVWIGLGAPKQERFMAEHQGKVHGLMIGIGAGFDYLAGNIKRAPMWMQEKSLEWFYRMLQDPKRLFWRYVRTNTKFIWKTFIQKNRRKIK